MLKRIAVAALAASLGLTLATATAAQGAKLAAWLRAGRTQGPAPWFAGAGLALTVAF